MESSCIYCGCGCRLNYDVRNNKIIKITGDKRDDVSEGVPCIKGLTIHEVYNKNRIISPMIKKNGKFEKVTLSKALNHVYNNTKDLSPNQIFFNTSGKITNENNFVLQKFARICYETSNIDSCCGRLCHIATVMGMLDVFGNSNLTKMKNLKDVDTLLIIGSEPDKDYPVFYNKVLRRQDLKIVKVHSFIKSDIEREYLVNIVPGSETCLLNGLVNELIHKGLKSDIEGFKILKDRVKTFTSDYVCKTCRIDRKTYNYLTDTVHKSKCLGVFHGMALTQHVNSLENIHSLLNLVLLKESRILSLRGEINVQGVGDIGGSPGFLPTGDLSTRKELEKKWGKINESKGLNLIEALLLTPVKAVFLTEFDPFKSLPATKEVEENLKDAFITYFGSYNTDSSKKADVIIPIASLIESEGTITNGEKRLRKVNKVISSGLELWQILKIFSKRFGKEEDFNYSNSKSVLSEIVKLVKAYKSVNFEDLWKGIDQWADKEVKFKRFMPEYFDGLDDTTCDECKFLLTTYRSKYSFLGNEVTGNSKTLGKHREPAGFYFNPEDAKRLKIKEGSMIKVSSLTGSLKGKAYISDKIPKNIIGSYMHYSELKINTLFPVKFDEESFTPNYKSVAVMVDKL
ncbi:MAG: molybdopterin-dependent oxidoreductase [Nanoarchaeota archaeon]|nr:molybdopterin-dependent oxidoreductase [Nanoarchaeota archaeon]